jgi:hypothetical protein
MKYPTSSRIQFIKKYVMSYKVHRFEINMEEEPQRLASFLNGLKGEIVSIIPNIARTSLIQIYGVSRKIDFLLIVEKLSD